ncbi:MAG: hypothetical protein J1F01_06400 [Oscillospiraceae bacterium]|nr:hypothetical protein [Oscillospiraceae bacterium]
MKTKHVFLNILPLPLWIAYYLFTISNKELFMMPMDENVSLIIIIAFTIYNLFSKRVIEFLGRNLIGITSLTVGCLVSGQIYLKLCHHMSDEHYAVKSIPFDIAIAALALTAIACVISFFITKRRKGSNP